MNTSEIEEESVSISFLHLPQKRQEKPQNHLKKQSQNFDEINKLDHRLVVNIEIITPIQLQSYSFRKELKTYRYQRKPNTHDFFSNSRASEEREIQQIFGTFKDIFSEWRNKITNQFYIAFNNKDLFYFFHKPQTEDVKKNTKKGGSFLILGCRKTNYAGVLESYGIKYEKIEGFENESQNILLRNNEIQLFWRYLTNDFMQKTTHIQLVSNFYFMNSVEVLPIQLYNGKQQRPEYEYIANKKINILDEVQYEMYSIRMQGYWMKENLLNLYKKVQETCEGMIFYLKPQCHYSSKETNEFFSNL